MWAHAVDVMTAISFFLFYEDFVLLALVPLVCFAAVGLAGRSDVHLLCVPLEKRALERGAGGLRGFVGLVGALA